MNGLDRCFFDQRESQQHGDDCSYSYISLGRLHPYGSGSGSGSSTGSGRRRARSRGLSDSPTAPTTPTSASDNASDATLTDSELPLARDSTLLVQNGMLRSTYDRPDHEQMPPQVDPVVSGVLFETDTQTPDLGLDKDVSVLKKAAPKKYEYVWGNIAWFLFLHITSLYGLYLVFTSAKWQTNVFAFAVHLMCAIGIGAGSHRLWTHRCFKARTPLRILLMIWQTMGFQDCIFEWARDHRTHHKYADTDADPHNAERGLFFSHMGWLCCKKSPEVIEGGKRIDVSDLYADPVVMFQKKHYMKMMPILCFVLPTIIPVYFWGETWLNSFCVPTILRYTCGINVVWSINSFAHTFGYRPYDKSLNPRDNIGTWMICVEGFHNYHHTFPWDYRATEYPLYNMLTPTIVFIDLMAKIGQAYDLKSVSPDIIKQRAHRTGDGTHYLWGWDDPEFTEKLKSQYGQVTNPEEKKIE